MVVRLTLASRAEEQLWRLTAEVCALLADIEWVLIGGQMVALLEAEFGGDTGRTTTDVDVLVEVGGVTGSPRAVADRLTGAGFVAEILAEGIAYRFARGLDVVDLLAPDHAGRRADMTTVPPARTHSVPGGRQAIRRKRALVVTTGDLTFEVPVPSLAGALIIKAQAAASTERADRDLRDLARLLTVVPDPGALAKELTSHERRLLRDLTALRDIEHTAWRGMPNAQDGIIALSRLAGITRAL